MKKLLCILLLIPSLSWAAEPVDFSKPYARWSVGAVGGKVAAASAASDSCTGGLSLSAHFENTDTITAGGVAGGVNNGCTTNADTTWALSANISYSGTQETDGSYAIYCNTCTTGNAAVIGADVNINAGTLTFDIWVTTRNRYSAAVIMPVDDNNRISCWFQDTATMACEYKGNSTAVSINAGANQLSVDGWHSVVFKWRTGETDPSLSVQIDANAAVTSNTNLTALTSAPTTINVHKRYNGDNTFYIDKLKLYDSWQ